MSLTLSSPFDVPGNFFFDPSKITVTTSAVLAGSSPNFATDNPDIRLKSKFQADALVFFLENITAPAGSDVKFILCINSQDFWFNGSAWVISDGTFAQSNSGSEINTNAGSLDISKGVNLSFKSLLHSDTGSVSPDILSVILAYNFSILSVPSLINECVITGNLKDFSNAPVGEGTVKAFSERPVFHGNNLVAINTSGTIAADGSFALSVVETETIDEVVFVELNFQENGSPRQKVFRNVTVPNQATVELSSIVVPS